MLKLVILKVKKIKLVPLFFLTMLFSECMLFAQSNCKTRIIAEAETLYKMHLLNSNGTGFLISNTGLILTNRHVIEFGMDLKVTFLVNNIKITKPAKLIYLSKTDDLAILQADISDLSLNELPYTFNFKEEKLGLEIFTLGYPIPGLMGQNIKLTNGIISSKTGFLDDTSLYQISAPIQPGNSGSPIFDKTGNIIGVVVSSLILGQNVNYGIKSKLLKDIFTKVGMKAKVNYNSNSKNNISTYDKYICLISSERIRTNYPEIEYKENSTDIFKKPWFETNEYGCYGNDFLKYIESAGEENFGDDVCALTIYYTYVLNTHWNFQTLFNKTELLYKIGAYENVIKECEKLNPYSEKNDKSDLFSFYSWLFPSYMHSKFMLYAPYNRSEIVQLISELNAALNFANRNFDLKDKFYIKLKASFLAYIGFCYYAIDEKAKGCPLINEAKQLDSEVEEYKCN